MTILIVLLGLLLSHLLYPRIHPRNFGWFDRVLGAVKKKASGREWLPAAAVFGIAIAISVVVSVLIGHSLGTVGWFVLALAVFVYTLGPRDLDRDVDALLAGGNGSAHVEALRVMRIGQSADATAASAGIFHAAQTRWFGILFWFVTLGIAGALLYRLTRLSLHFPDWTEAEAAWLVKLRFVLDWPVLMLMLISAGLAGDLDAVRRTWQSHVSARSPWFVRDDVLDGVAALSVAPEASFEEGVQAGHNMVRRMLLIWLVVLSLLLIAGWLS